MNLLKDYSYGYPSSTTSMNQEFARARLQQRTVCVRLRCGDGHLARWCYMMHLWCYMYDTSWLQEQHLLIPKLTHTWIGTPFPPRPIFMPPLAALTGSWGSWQNVGDQESTRVHVLFGNDDVGPPWFTLLRSQNHQTGGFFGWPFLQIPRYQHTKIPRYRIPRYPFSTVGCRLWYVPVDSQVIISAVGVSVFTGVDHSQKICWCSL